MSNLRPQIRHAIEGLCAFFAIISSLALATALALFAAYAGEHLGFWDSGIIP